MKKNKNKKENPLTTLKSYAKHRILNDMFENARKRAMYSKEYMIMIVDKQAMKVFSSCCKIFDLYQQSQFHIERLEIVRKKFPNSDAIYFVTPT